MVVKEVESSLWDNPTLEIGNSKNNLGCDSNQYFSILTHLGWFNGVGLRLWIVLLSRSLV